MSLTPPFAALRSEIRLRADDIIRWKRAGRVEDHKGWTLDRSPSSIGFLAPPGTAPEVGDVLHIRQWEDGGWRTIEKTVRIARAQLTPTRDLVMIGCTLE
jgi:hypothetical protein